MGESFQFARAFWNRSPDRLMACAALMSHGRWMHLRICRKRASSTSYFGFVPERNPIRRDLFRLLRPSRERRKSETDSENDREPDQSHGTPRWRMAGGSLADESYSLKPGARTSTRRRAEEHRRDEGSHSRFIVPGQLAARGKPDLALKE